MERRTATHNVLDAVMVDAFTGEVFGAGALFTFGLCGLRSRRRPIGQLRLGLVRHRLRVRHRLY